MLLSALRYLTCSYVAVWDMMRFVGREICGMLLSDYRTLRHGLAVLATATIFSIRSLGREISRMLLSDYKALRYYGASAWDGLATAWAIHKGGTITESCGICLDGKSLKEMVIFSGCAHGFCRACVVQHAKMELKHWRRPPSCPEPHCRTQMAVEQCEKLLSKELLEFFNKLLAEALVPERERLYCPYKNCREMLQREGGSESAATHVRCVWCKREFCRKCMVPSHAPWSCKAYQKLPAEERVEDSLTLHRLAAFSGWKRCAHCRMIIQRNGGCNHMRCRSVGMSALVYVLCVIW